ncbi:MAG: ATP-binding cassette domain-containing protein, partial [Parvularculaceae bacterium]|nr:ATP-binding cassette domain-containing protein [Parvularculaceae bacterium]
QRLSRSSQAQLAEASARASEALRAVETIQAFTREDHERSRFAGAVESTFAMAMRRVRVRSLMSAVIFASILSGLIGVLWLGALQVQAGVMTAGAMTQFVLYAFIAVSGAGVLTETYAEVMRAAGATERLMELISTPSDLPVPAKPAVLYSPIKGSVAFDAVSFAYPQRPTHRALEQVSFSVAPGETVALVGPSGAGKSTIFQLLARFYDPVEGHITFDGQDLRQLNPNFLREQIAIVQQDAPLFSGSVLDNIRFGNLAATDDQVVQAAKVANADGFISDLPEGYKTLLGEGGRSLSGGQRQRIAIARAVLRDAPLLLLDEATSALDSESEAAIREALESIAVHKTTLIIAHRLSTVRNADKILFIENGQIQAAGTHKELLQQEGRYAEVAKLQFGTEPLAI